MSKYYFNKHIKVNVYKYIDNKLHCLNNDGNWVNDNRKLAESELAPFDFKTWYFNGLPLRSNPWPEILKAAIIKDILYED